MTGTATRIVLALLGALAFATGADAADIRLLTTGAFKPIALDLIADFERESGHKVTVENDTAGAIVRRINDGNTNFDVVVLTIDALEKMIGENKIVDDTVTPLVRVGVGAAVRLGAPRPDLSNAEAVRRTLLAAKAVAYMDPGAGATSGIYLEQLFQRLGILPQIRAKAVKVVGGLSAQRVASGQADIALQQYSEILQVPGVQYAGLLPPSVQNYTIYAGAVGAKARDRDAALGLLSIFSDPGNEPLLKKRGVEMP